jgi:hypothetical protein
MFPDPEDRRHKKTVQLTVTQLVVTVLLGLGGWAWSAVQIYQSQRPDSPDERIAKCRDDNNAPRKTTSEDGGNVTFHNCSWPGVPGADKDGYYTIMVTRHGIPGAVNADEFTMVDVIDSECQSYELEYRFEYQGVAVVLADPVTLRSGQIVAFIGKPLDEPIVNGSADDNRSPEIRAATVPASLTDEVGEQPNGRLIVLSHGNDISRLVCTDS